MRDGQLCDHREAHYNKNPKPTGDQTGIRFFCFWEAGRPMQDTQADNAVSFLCCKVRRNGRNAGTIKSAMSGKLLEGLSCGRRAQVKLQLWPDSTSPGSSSSNSCGAEVGCATVVCSRGESLQAAWRMAQLCFLPSQPLRSIYVHEHYASASPSIRFPFLTSSSRDHHITPMCVACIACICHKSSF